MTLKELHTKIGNLLEYEDVSPDLLVFVDEDQGGENEPARGIVTSLDEFSFGHAEELEEKGSYNFYSDGYYEENEEDFEENAIVFWVD